MCRPGINQGGHCGICDGSVQLDGPAGLDAGHGKEGNLWLLIGIFFSSVAIYLQEVDALHGALLMMA